MFLNPSDLLADIKAPGSKSYADAILMADKSKRYAIVDGSTMTTTLTAPPASLKIRKPVFTFLLNAELYVDPATQSTDGTVVPIGSTVPRYKVAPNLAGTYCELLEPVE